MSDMRLGVGLPEKSNADGPLGFVDIPPTNDGMVIRDQWLFSKMLYATVVTFVLFLAMFGWLVFVTFSLSWWLLPWVMVANLLYSLTAFTTLYYYAHYRGKQEMERTYLQQGAAYVHIIRVLQSQLQSRADGPAIEIAQPDASNTDKLKSKGDLGDIFKS